MVNNKPNNKNWPEKWGTEAQGTHCREGDTRHNALLDGKTGDTSRPQTVSSKLQKIAEQAAHYPNCVFTTLVHLIDFDFLHEAYHRTRKDAAPGLDGVTAEEYSQHLEENLQDLYERVRNGGYKAPPVKRAWLDKEDGSKRAIGVPEFEDKVLQRAVSMILGAIYEQDFHDFSYGFREGRSAHQALTALRENCMNMGIAVIVDVDIRGFFDNLDRSKLREIIKQRVNDGAILRLIGKWFNAGVMEGKTMRYPDKGTVQGGVISPVLSNIFLHHVLDEWYVKTVKPRLKGRSFLIRFADDFTIGCELEEDAKRIMEALPKRFAEFNLAINSEKTKLVSFRKPDHKDRTKGNGTFDFLGFTHYWAKSLRGNWVIKRKTSRKRLLRAKRRLWLWCRNNKHTSIEEQHQTLCQKLLGHYQYYGIRCNMRKLESIFRFTQNAWHYWLSRRGGKKGNWDKFRKMLVNYLLPGPRIVHCI
jgi:RNA-directed DNA polymerase